MDSEKAYDILEWSFIYNTILSLGFPIKITNTIMRCITTVSFYILINGQPTQNLSPSRGFRQGDPIPPIFFIICVDVFLTF